MEVGTATSYTFNNLNTGTAYQVEVKANCLDNLTSNWTALEVTTLANRYTVTAIAVGPGTITPSGIQYYEAGSTPTYTFTPSEGAIIEAVIVSGNVVGISNSYTFAPLQNSDTIYVYFNKITPCNAPLNLQSYNITTNSIEVNWMDMNFENLMEFELRYKENNTTSTWINIEVGTATNYTLTNLLPGSSYRIQVKSKCANNTESDWAPNNGLVVTTIVPEFVITATAFGPGTITPIGVSHYQQGLTPTYTFLPDLGAIVDFVIISGDTIDATEQYTFAPIFDNETIDVYFKNISNGIQEVTLNENIKLYPNPASSHITISINNGTISNVDILDVTGRVVLRPAAIENQNITVNTHSLQSGVYIARIVTPAGIASVRFIVEN